MEHLISEKWFWVAIWCAGTLIEGAFIWVLFTQWMPLQNEIEEFDEVNHDH